MSTVTIYTTPTCGYCHMAKAYFTENNIQYTEKDVAADLAAREEMVAKTKQTGVPVIDINGSLVVGFDQPRLAQLLGV